MESLGKLSLSISERPHSLYVEHDSPLCLGLGHAKGSAETKLKAYSSTGIVTAMEMSLPAFLGNVQIRTCDFDGSCLARIPFGSLVVYERQPNL